MCLLVFLFVCLCVSLSFFICLFVCLYVCVFFSFHSFYSIYFHLFVLIFIFIIFLNLFFWEGTLVHHDFLSFEYLIFSSRLWVIKLRDKKWALSKFVWTDRPHGFTVPHVVLVAYVLGGSHMIARWHVQALGLAHAIIIRSLHIRRSSPWCNTSHGFVDNYFFEKSLIQSKLLLIIR